MQNITKAKTYIFSLLAEYDWFSGTETGIDKDGICLSIVTSEQPTICLPGNIYKINLRYKQL
jgi:hypothetical protein